MNEIRPTCMAPLASNPIDERAGVGIRTSAPFAITIPEGALLPFVKKSPLIPATTALPEAACSSWVTVARGPVTVLPASTGPIVSSPVGGGAVITE